MQKEPIKVNIKFLGNVGWEASFEVNTIGHPTYKFYSKYLSFDDVERWAKEELGFCWKRYVWNRELKVVSQILDEISENFTIKFLELDSNKQIEMPAEQIPDFSRGIPENWGGAQDFRG